MESRLWYPYRRCGRSYIPLYVLLPRRWMGYRRRDFVSVWHAHVLRCFHGLPLPIGLEQVEGAAVAVGPCRHLLAYNPHLLGHHAHRAALDRGLGVGFGCLFIALRLGGDGHEVRSEEDTSELQ